jgi:steroid 5-alpha reductase family enzyme
MNLFIQSALIIAGFMLILYLISRIIKNNSIVDVFWGIGFSVVAAFHLLISDGFYWQILLFNCLVIAWGTRLALHIFIRNKGKGEDFRYAAWRKEWGKSEPLRAFLQIYLLQGSIMYVMSLMIIQVNLSEPPFSSIQYILIAAGIVVFLLGFATESIADYQKFVFKQKLPQGIMTSGLWKYSRHPNYLGEVVLWFGLLLYSTGTGNGWWGLLSFLIIFLLIRYVSGVPMLEKAKKGNPKYQRYAEKTPVFFPFVKKT